MCIFALSASLPSIASTKADSAVVLAASASAADVQRALAAAELASRLDPLSDAGLRVEATIAQRQGQLPQARAYLLSAVKRDPSDAAAWGQLMQLEFFLGDVRDAVRAATRVMELDPMRQDGASLARLIAEVATLSLTPPKDSPTAQPLAGR
jgi:tetratricopeptide (TPR) repeat protein